MKVSFWKELIYQIFVASLTVITFPAIIAFLVAGGPAVGFSEPYLIYLVFSAPVFYTGGVLFSALIEWSKRQSAGTAFSGSTAAYLVSLVAYALAGVASMYLYLVTILRNLQIHTSNDVYGLLALGAGAALYMYHVSLLLKFVRKNLAKSKEGDQ